MVTALLLRMRPLLRTLGRALRGGGMRRFNPLPGVPRAVFAPAPMQLMQMAMGSWVTQTIYVAAKLKIADVLSREPKTCDELAAAIHTPTQALSRLLRALSSLGIVTPVDSGRFALTAIGRSLEAERVGSLRSMMLTIGEIHYDAWGSLLHSVKTGTAAFPRIFGAALFDHLDRNVQAGDTFHQAMSESSALISLAVLAAYDFSAIDVLADIGGGYGRFLTAILQAYPSMRGVLMDTPAVVAVAAQKLELHPCRLRCALVAGNLLEAVPSRAGGYLLSGVLHDWDDEDAVRILDNCRRAMAPAAKVLVVESVLAATADTFGPLLDLNMLVMTGGRERTEEDFRRLFKAAGLAVTQVIPTLGPQCVIEGRAE